MQLFNQSLLTVLVCVSLYSCGSSGDSSDDGSASNTVPIASDDSVSTKENATLNITLSASDENNDSLAYSIQSTTSNGTISLVDDVVTYTPTAEFEGSDSFTFSVNDGTDESNTATISITVEDSDFMLFLGDKNVSGEYELYRTDYTGSSVVQVSGTPSGGYVAYNFISPDQSTIAYTGDLDGDGIYAVYTADADGSNSTIIVNDLAGYNAILSWSSDSNQLFVWGHLDSASIAGIFVMDKDGSNVTRLSTGMNASSGLNANVFISDDGSKLLYLADKEADGETDLYIAAIDGSSDIKLSGTIVDGGHVQDTFAPQFLTDSNLVVYAADADTDDVYELYVADIAAVTANSSVEPTKISGNLVSGGSLFLTAIALSPDKSKLYYSADQDTDILYELYVLDMSDYSNTKVTGTTTNTIIAAWTDDSSQILFIKKETPSDTGNLYIVDAGGNNELQLSDTLQSSGTVSDFLLSPDNLKVAYIADKTTDGQLELFLVDIDGSNNIQISDSSVAADATIDVGEFYWSPDNNKITYIADPNTDGMTELFVTTLDATTVLKISGEMAAADATHGIFQDSVEWTDDSEQVIYLSDRNIGGTDELYIVNSDGSNEVNLSGSIVSGGTIQCHVNSESFSPECG